MKDRIVIVGGGVIGASVAYHLAHAGCRDVVVLERAADVGAGSASRATGGFRALFGTPLNAALSALSHAKPGHLVGYRPCGYLFLSEADDLQERLRRLAAPVAAARVVDQEEIRVLNPAVDIENVVGGVFCTQGGFIRPLGMLRRYLDEARRLGVQVRFNTGPVRPRRVGGRIVGAGDVDADIVVVSAGAWSGTLGLPLPVRPEKRQIVTTEPFDGLPEDMPMTIFVKDGFHLRARDGRVLLLAPADLTTEDPFDTTFDPAPLKGLVRRAHACVPIMASARIDVGGSWAGLYGMTPDGHPLLGPVADIPGLFVAAGACGHGVMHAPALGQLLAERIVGGRASSLDIHPLRPERFREGAPLVGSPLL